MTTPSAECRLWDLLVIAVAAGLAVIGARDSAGCWNDGSRLATVECLVDYHTLAIDRSIFVDVPAQAPLPYPADDAGLLRYGTGDKLLIDRHFYSDKSPVPALFLGGVYQVLQFATGLTARDRPDRFVFAMTLASSGLAYVVAAWCIWALGRAVQLALRPRLFLTASFAVATIAWAYSRQVNNHVLLLGVATGVHLGLCRLPLGANRQAAVVGGLAGLGYAIDLGAGPVLLTCTVALVAYRCRSLSVLAITCLAAVPWLVLHHSVNYAVGGTFKPANAVPEYFQWPGCTFNAQNLTGGWNHKSFGHALLYAGDLLVGRRGFLLHNLPLLLVVPGAVVLLRNRKTPHVPDVLFALAWSGGTWLAYGLTSNNLSGLCCSVRWFVPLLAPGFHLLALLLRERPRYEFDLLVLSSWGMVIGGLCWWQGPWMPRMVPGYWFLIGAAAVSWILARRWRADQPRSAAQLASPPLRQAA